MRKGEPTPPEWAAHVWITKAGLPAAIAVGPGGHGCGYVLVPPGHPHFATVDVDGLDVHGGITYRDDVGWIGFDTAHAWDTWFDPDIDELVERTPEPYREHLSRHIHAMRRVHAELEAAIGLEPVLGEQVWTVERLEAEVEALAAQLVEDR